MNTRISCSEPIDQLIRRHAKTISTPKHHFHPKELQTLAMLDDMLSMLGEKYPKQVFPTFDQQWRAEKTHYALAGFHVRDQAVVAGLAKHQIVGKCDAEGMYQFDAGAIEALRTMHIVAQCQRGHAFELAKLTQSSSLTSDATRTSALTHWLPQKLKQLVALKESMGAAASGVTVYIGAKDGSYSVVGCSIKSREAYDYLLNRGLTPAPTKEPMGYGKTRTITYPAPAYAKGMCIGPDTLQHVLTFVQPRFGGRDTGGAIGR